MMPFYDPFSHIAAEDNITVPFGKYRGRELDEIAQTDRGYLDWLSNTDWGRENIGSIKDALVAASRAAVAAVPPPTLTPHQENIVGQLTAAFEAGAKVLFLEGGAGYGKSYATQALVRYFAGMGYVTHAAAVSYVATQVLAAQLEPLGVACTTIARALKFTKDYDQETGKEVYGHSDETPAAIHELLGPNRVFLIDEASMVSDRDADVLLKNAHRLPGVLVLVGDSAQLPPVKQATLSQFCRDAEPKSTATLTQPMRYGTDSPLYGVEQTMRNLPGSWRTLISHNPEHGICLVKSMDDMYQEYMRNYRADPLALHRMLLFRRAEVIDANNWIRRQIWGEAAEEAVVEDELLMILATTDTPYYQDLKESRKYSTRYYSGQMYRISTLERASYEIEIEGTIYTIPHYLATFAEISGPVRIMFGIDEQRMDKTKHGSPEYMTALAAARAYGREAAEAGFRDAWEPWKQLQRDFLRVAYTYATSVHRAQGQTVDYAYTVPQTLLSVGGIMGKALAYVACTRARKRLTLLT